MGPLQPVAHPLRPTPWPPQGNVPSTIGTNADGNPPRPHSRQVNVRAWRRQHMVSVTGRRPGADVGDRPGATTATATHARTPPICVCQRARVAARKQAEFARHASSTCAVTTVRLGAESCGATDRRLDGTTVRRQGEGGGAPCRWLLVQQLLDRAGHVSWIDIATPAADNETLPIEQELLEVPLDVRRLHRERAPCQDSLRGEQRTSHANMWLECHPLPYPPPPITTSPTISGAHVLYCRKDTRLLTGGQEFCREHRWKWDIRVGQHCRKSRQRQKGSLTFIQSYSGGTPVAPLTLTS